METQIPQNQTLVGSIVREITSDGFRVRAEIHFARGNFLSAMQNYLVCLIVTTSYFQKPWSNYGLIPSQDWDERIFQKMIKCTSELGHHLQVLVTLIIVVGSELPLES